MSWVYRPVGCIFVCVCVCWRERGNVCCESILVWVRINIKHRVHRELYTRQTNLCSCKWLEMQCYCHYMRALAISWAQCYMAVRVLCCLLFHFVCFCSFFSVVSDFKRYKSLPFICEMCRMFNNTHSRFMDNLGKLRRDLDSVSDFLLLFNTSLTYSTCVRYCYCYCELAIFPFFHTAVFCCCFCFFSTSFTGIIDCEFYALCVAGCDKIGWVVILWIVASNQQTTQRTGRQPMNEKTWTVISTAGIMIIWVLAPMDSVLNEKIIAHFKLRFVF